jgi:anti-sigma B factor antagonist
VPNKQGLGPENHPDRWPAGDALRIEVAEPRPGTVVLTVHGEVDMLTAPQLRECLLEKLQSQTRVVLDVRASGFFSSSGIAVLIHGVELATERAAEFRIVLPDGRGPLRRVLEAVGLLEHLPIYYSLEAACSSSRRDHLDSD